MLLFTACLLAGREATCLLARMPRKAHTTGLEELETEDIPPAIAKQLAMSFARGLLVIRAFGSDAERLTLSEIAARANLTRGGARRLLLTLVHLGYAGQEGRHFFLKPKILSLGYSYVTSMPLWRFAQPVLERLVAELKETCSLSVLDGDEIVYLLRIPVRRMLSMSVSVGTRLPAYSTSMGRVLLASLPDKNLDKYLDGTERIAFTDKTVVDKKTLKSAILRVRDQGYAWIDGEMEEHISGLSVPVRDTSGAVLAALNISFSNRQSSKEDILRDILPRLEDGAVKIGSSVDLNQQFGGVTANPSPSYSGVMSESG